MSDLHLYSGEFVKIFHCKECNIKTNKRTCPKCFEKLEDYEEVVLFDCDTKGFVPA